MLDVTPDRAAAVYDMLRHFEPWHSLALPPAEEVEFHVRARRDCYAEYQHTGTTHAILISAALIGGMDTLVSVMGHEMLHVAQHINGTSNEAQHNREFRRLARIACHKCVWDERAFVG